MLRDLLPFIDSIPFEIRNFIIRALVLVLALLLIWISRRFLTRLVTAPLRRIVERTPYDMDNRILDAVIPSVRLVVVAAGLLLSAELLLERDFWFERFINTVASVVLVIAVASALYRLIDLLLPSGTQLLAVTGIRIDERLLPFLRVVIKGFILVVGIVIILQEFGYDITGLVAGLGISGLGLTLAAQDTVANLFGFAQIVGDRPFNVGEYIVTDQGEGIVENVGIWSTRIRRLDQALITVPNRIIANNAVTNWSRLYKRRMDYVLGVTYDTTPQQMQLLLERIRLVLAEWPTVQSDSVQVYFLKFGDSSLDLLVRAYVMISDWGAFHAEQEKIHLEVMRVVDEMNLSIAFPSTSLYVENLPDIVMGNPDRMPPEPQIKDNRLSPRERAILQQSRRQSASLHPDQPNDDDDPDEGEQRE